MSIDDPIHQQCDAMRDGCNGQSDESCSCQPGLERTERRQRREKTSEQSQPGGGPDRRLSVVDRRGGTDRRQLSAKASGYTGPERRVADRRADSDTGLERRRGPGRRLSDDRRTAEEGEMTPEQFEFVMAMQTYKKVNKRLYPTWTEVLEVIQQLGYRKIHNRQITLENVPEPELATAAD